MIITTTNNIEGKKITDYLDIVTGEVILGAHIGRDFMASLTDVFGGRSGSYEKSVQEARDKAMEEMKMHAQNLGADAVVGVDVDYETIKQGMIMVSASGTAVKLS